MNNKKRVITGIKPTNRIHIGNYFGALDQIISLTKDNLETYVFIPDLHSLTNSHRVKENSNYIMKTYLSTLDSNKIIFYKQSDYPEITFFTWLFSCCTPYGHLKRMTQFKSADANTINSGYLNYPLLMAADILSIDADIVPVGIDQKQHIEITRDIVNYFHNKFDVNLFKMPEGMYSDAEKIYSLGGTYKMSKSDENEMNTIFLDDSNDAVAQKIKKAKSDAFNMPLNILECKENRPEIFNLCLIYSLMSKKSFTEMERQFGGGGIGVFKKELTDLCIDFLKPIQENLNNITDTDIQYYLNRDKEKISNLMNIKMNLIRDVIL
jgi:tryptophanyl-tRNA synthetase